MLTLRGITWNHPRGIDPLVDCCRQYARSAGVAVEWSARSLEEFEATPLPVLAAQCDLMVVDHPHVGKAAGDGSLRPFEPGVLDSVGPAVGQSHQSYHYAGRQWALAIDAAAQVACRREGAMSSWPATWDEVLGVARDGGALWPLAPVHALMSFFTLCANAGAPCHTHGERLIADASVADDVLSAMRALAALVPAECFDMNPIRVLERLSDGQSPFVYAPHTYGYVSYATAGFRPARLQFNDLPGFRAATCRGSTLGGTGIAVSARSAHPGAAAAVARFLAGAAAQSGPYAVRGQPAHREAWLSDAVNSHAGGFYRNTLKTLETAYVRPRFAGYVAFQALAGRIVSECLKRERTPRATLAALDDAFVQAQRGA